MAGKVPGFLMMYSFQVVHRNANTQYFGYDYFCKLALLILYDFVESNLRDFCRISGDI